MVHSIGDVEDSEEWDHAYSYEATNPHVSRSRVRESRRPTVIPRVEDGHKVLACRGVHYLPIPETAQEVRVRL